MKHQKVGAVVRVSLGNFLEMYDFMVFGYYAAAIGRAFFPTHKIRGIVRQCDPSPSRSGPSMTASVRPESKRIGTGRVIKEE